MAGAGTSHQGYQEIVQVVLLLSAVASGCARQAVPAPQHGRAVRADHVRPGLAYQSSLLHFKPVADPDLGDLSGSPSCWVTSSDHCPAQSRELAMPSHVLERNEFFVLEPQRTQ